MDKTKENKRTLSDLQEEIIEAQAKTISRGFRIPIDIHQELSKQAKERKLQK